MELHRKRSRCKNQRADDRLSVVTSIFFFFCSLPRGFIFYLAIARCDRVVGKGERAGCAKAVFLWKKCWEPSNIGIICVPCAKHGELST
ncbi:hypothetical protein PUN28_018111 [Cardiocondyla obscurior]|uniref:Secreted protein n=1 Tax=Cardiocondyla obscurior TaxID=286306 RepID=A0AAW2EFU3_9HYME